MRRIGASGSEAIDTGLARQCRWRSGSSPAKAAAAVTALARWLDRRRRCGAAIGCGRHAAAGSSACAVRRRRGSSPQISPISASAGSGAAISERDQIEHGLVMRVGIFVGRVGRCHDRTDRHLHAPRSWRGYRAKLRSRRPRSRWRTGACVRDSRSPTMSASSTGGGPKPRSSLEFRRARRRISSNAALQGPRRGIARR